ncbi:MAG: transglycosylase domain-containing protein [Oscillospiraceae bacterium]|nr:transglycosylase domain-containing protein [Oscillospiraceae bacterium]
MADKNTRGNEPQSWEPHKALRILYKIWMALFSVIKIVAGAAVTVALICGVCVFVVVGIVGDYLESDILPNADLNLDDFTLDMSSFLYYVDGDGKIQPLQRIYSDTKRQWADLEDMPEDLIHATVAIEDKRFYEHQGVDWFTTIKACAGMFFGGGTAGGSSLTQQLIKNLTGENSFTVQRKVMEIFRAVCVERSSTKDQIIELYLNTVYFGNGYNGVRSAAEYYFGKELELLTTAECASLISITNNPSIFDPYRKAFEEGGKTGAERNRERQTIVLKEMCNQGWITKEEYDEAIAQEMVFESGVTFEERLNTCPNESCGYRDVAANFKNEGEEYFCPRCGTKVVMEQVSNQGVYSWFTETVLEDLAKEMAQLANVEWNDASEKLYMELIRRGGYHIYTTMDPVVQAQVDEIYGNLDYIPDTKSGQQLQSSIVVVDNRTGDIVALAGGVGEKEQYDAWNRALARLQSGSSIKPLSVYAPAFELGAINPATVVYDKPLQYNGNSVWPNNDTREFSYKRTIFEAVEDSVNAAAANTLDGIGISYSYEFAKYKFGLSTLIDSNVTASGWVQTDKDYGPLALGAQTKGITVRDMTCAYATFANGGVWREGRTFLRVYDSNGNKIIENEQESRELLSDKTVTYMNYCLVNAVNNGTGAGAAISGIDVAGKTGSTSSWRDRWFCGFTGYYTAAVWCGYDIPETITLSSGSYNPAARMWRNVMRPLHAGKTNISLYDENKMVDVTVCLDSGKLATSACYHDVRQSSDFTRVKTAKVYPEDVPKAYCDKHMTVNYCTTGDGVANEYCTLFSMVENLDPATGFTPAVVQQMSLLKMTQKEIDELNTIIPHRLWEQFYEKAYVYQIDESGAPSVFKGFTVNGALQYPGNTSPCKYCTVHTKAAWEEYSNQNLSGGTVPTE